MYTNHSYNGEDTFTEESIMKLDVLFLLYDKSYCIGLLKSVPNLAQ